MGRKDGKKVKKMDPMYRIIPYIMNKRYDSMNMITLDIPLEPIKEYIHRKRSEDVSISHMAVLVAAYTRTIQHFPELNRFVMNRKFYDRNEISCSMVVLKNGETDQSGTISKFKLQDAGNIFDIQRILTEYIENNRAVENTNSTDKAMKFLLAVPGLAKIGVGLCKFLDKHGMLPKKLIEASPFHASFLITNLASIRTNAIYHHIYEFGTTSISMAMGTPRDVVFKDKDSVYAKNCLPLGVVMDERICSGHYFAMAFAKMKTYLSNPELLEKSFEEEISSES